MDASGLRFLIDLHRRGALPIRAGAVAEIGAQELFLEGEPQVLLDFLAQFGEAAVTGKEELQTLAQRGPARRLFELARWSYACIDTSGEFDAITLDLNFDPLPDQHRGRYDLVTNFGCTEHVANQLNAFRVIHDLGKIGSIMVHCVPVQGFIDHGLVNYSAKFFWRLAEYNDYRLIDMRLTTYGQPRSVPDTFAQTFSSFDRTLEMRDTILSAAFQKTKPDEFIVPFDGAIRSKELARRYPAALVEKYNAIF